MTKRLDPTLEADLISKVQTAQDSAALTRLIDHHSGAYFDVVNRYAQAYPNTIKTADLTDDRYLNLWTFVRDYNPARGAKLSTYIQYRTDYLCKDLLRDTKTDPLSGAVCLSSGASPDSLVEDPTLMTDIPLIDDDDVVDNADKDLKIDEIMEIARRVCMDQRFLTILQYRHFNKSSSAMSLSWRQIGKMLGLSHEGCRLIYRDGMERVKREMSKVA